MCLFFLLFTLSFINSYTHENSSQPFSKKSLEKDVIPARARKNNRFHPFYLRQGQLHRFALKNSPKPPAEKFLRILTHLCSEPQKVSMSDYLALQNALTSKKSVGSFSLHPHVMIYYDIKSNGYKKASLAYFIGTSSRLDKDTKADFLERLGGLKDLKTLEFTEEFYNRTGTLKDKRTVTL